MATLIILPRQKGELEGENGKWDLLHDPFPQIQPMRANFHLDPVYATELKQLSKFLCLLWLDNLLDRIDKLHAFCIRDSQTPQTIPGHK